MITNLAPFGRKLTSPVTELSLVRLNLTDRVFSLLETNQRTVFLRILEYYPGILFLTTNRVGSFDPGFRSRIHLSLYYPKLDRDKTMRIWHTNLDRIDKNNQKRLQQGLKKIMYDREHIMDYVVLNWNTLMEWATDQKCFPDCLGPCRVRR